VYLLLWHADLAKGLYGLQFEGVWTSVGNRMSQSKKGLVWVVSVVARGVGVRQYSVFQI
jgi:hypothetical protein